MSDRNENRQGYRKTQIAWKLFVHDKLIDACIEVARANED